MDSIEQYLDSAKPYLDEYGYVAVFVGILLEGVGVPMPGLTLLVAATLLASQEVMRLPLVLLCTFTAATVGNMIGYALGRYGGRQLILRLGTRLGIINETHLHRMEGFFERHGGAVIVGARFLDIFRQVNGIVAGIVEMPWWRFFFYNALGAALWVGFWSMGVFYLGSHLNIVMTVVERFEPYLIGIGIVLLVWMLIYLVQWHRSKNTNRES